MPAAPDRSSSSRLVHGERDRVAQRLADLIRTGRRARRGAEGSQEKFAQAIGVGRRTLQYLESGNSSVSLDTWLSALQELGLLHAFAAAIASTTDTVGVASAAAVAAHAARRRSGAGDDEAPHETLTAEFPSPAPRLPRKAG